MLYNEHGNIVYVGIRPDETIASRSLENARFIGNVILVEYVGSRRYIKVKYS